MLTPAATLFIFDIKQFHNTSTKPSLISQIVPVSLRTNIHHHFNLRTTPSKPITSTSQHINMSAMAQSRQQVYVSDGFSEPMSAQHNFANNFNLDNPDEAMSAYQRIMHEHTKRQLSTATDSARRRSGASTSPGAQSVEYVETHE